MAAIVELKTEVAIPAVVCTGEMTKMPLSLVIVTKEPSSTALPDRSVTVAVSTLFAPTTFAAEGTVSVTVAAGPGVNVTDVVPVAAPAVALTCAVPTELAMMEDVAIPLSVVTGETTVPLSVVKVTVMPLPTRLPKLSEIVAVSTLLAPTTCDAGLAVSVN